MVAVSAILVAACADTNGQSRPGTATQTTAQVPQNLSSDERALISIVQRVSPAVVGVRTNSGQGSGVIIRADGLILTNAHVVGGSRNVLVSLANGTETEGRVLGMARTVDVAVIDIEGRNLPTASLGDSDVLQAGQSTIAIGNPIGLDRTVTTGILSGMNRTLGIAWILQGRKEGVRSARDSDPDPVRHQMTQSATEPQSGSATRAKAAFLMLRG
jgi:S1-C subfamily serine protease